MQADRLTAIAVGSAEAVEDAFLAAVEDGYVCPVEQVALRELIVLAVDDAEDADEATALAVVITRRGPESQRFRRLLRARNRRKDADGDQGQVAERDAPPGKR